MQQLKRFALPILIFLISIAIYVLKPTIGQLGDHLENISGKVAYILFVGSFAWAVVVLLRLIKKLVIRNLDVHEEDNLRSRKLQTQYTIVERVLIFVVILIAIAFVLMSFDSIKQIGISIFASAGVAGIILGLAAQRVFGSILAGLQIAFTQPIRVDDVVVVEGEWGWIEEITLTYVVVRIWDKRRLIVPCTYFMEKPFQNWTRTSADILGTVFIYADYDINFDLLRKELTRLLEKSSLWDGKVNTLQVTEAKENRVEVRALVSSRNSPELWDLRVYIREGLIKYLQSEFPESLPKIRVFLENDPTTKK